MRLIPIFLIFFIALSQSISFGQSSACTSAYPQKIDTVCNLITHTVNGGQSQSWLEFEASSENIELITSLNDIAPVMSAVHLIRGNYI